LACICLCHGLYRLRTDYFGIILKNLLPEKYPNLNATKREAAP